jgi:DNA (cytosine-5)-methyltransferase 1
MRDAASSTSETLQRPVAVDLFAGAGGLSLGLEQAGFEIGAAVESGPGPANTHRLNFPNTPLVEKDIRSVTASALTATIRSGFEARRLSWSGSVVLCSGGPPCQGYSVGGRRRQNDERNTLVHQFKRLATKLHSRYFVMENVPGMLLRHNLPRLKALIRAFKRSGYEVADPMILNASDFGLPQSRRRVILVGWKSGERAVDIARLQNVRHPIVNVGDAIGDLPEVEGISSLAENDVYVLPLRKKDRSEYALRMRELSTGLAHPRTWDGRTLSGCARTLHKNAIVRRFEKTESGTMEPVSRYFRLSTDGLAPTIRAGTGPEHGSHTPPRPIHYETARVITVREAARLQSFPDWFQFAPTKWHAWREIGNAVPPLLARALGEAVFAAANPSLVSVVTREERHAQTAAT